MNAFEPNIMNITQLSQLDLNGSYTVVDYLSWQFDEMVELIKGHIYAMSPAPRSGHQKVNRYVVKGFEAMLPADCGCEIFYAPFDVYLGGIEGKKTTVVKPDICIICDIAKIEPRGCVGAPDLIVEITSPSTIKKDFNEKYNLYEEYGVKEYWIVQPETQQVLCSWLDNNGKYVQTGNYLEASAIPVHIFEGKSLQWGEIFT